MRRVPAAVIALAVAAPLTLTTPATSADGDNAGVSDVNTERLQERVTVGGILAHQRVLQRIADQNGGTRASGTSGYDASARYVLRTLENAGYRVRKQVFTFPFFRDVSDPSLSQVSPNSTAYETATFTYSGAGDVTGQLIPTNDVMIPPGPEPSSSNSGCEASDFVPAPDATSIALVQRGFCFFEDKARNAEAAGYAAVVIFNEGQEGRTELLTGTLGRPFDIPVLGLSFADGKALYRATQRGEVTVNAVADTETDLAAKTSNILATSPQGNPDKTLVVGAHLDSVLAGPGVNDNGSGTGAVLEIAEQMAGMDLRQRVRFAFWGGEESGLLGSTHYVDSISNKNLSSIFANLNFDMIGSSNYARFVYDGDGSDSDPAGPPGSAEIEDVFVDHFNEVGLSSDPTPFSGRSDYGPFIAVGIPAGGLFSGAEGIKTDEQAAEFGGEAGVAYDPCYHQACDTIGTVNTKALSEMSDAAADATLTLARSRTGLFDDGSFVAARRQPSTVRPQGVR